MSFSQEVVIRKYQPQDRTVVRRISYQTALLGHPESFCTHPELLEDLLTRYFTDYESGASFVAVYHDRVVGYLIGAFDEKQVNRAVFLRIFPALFIKAFWRGYFFQKKNWKFLKSAFQSFRQNEFKTPDLSRDYPAILHINLDQNFRQGGVGQRLMDAYFSLLKENHIRGVHVSTMTESAKRFFEKFGFQLLWTQERSYMEYVTGKKISHYILGKILT